MKKKSVQKSKPEMSDMVLEMIASRFRALSEPMRLRLLNQLMQGERSVGQLVEATSSSQANVSKHLAVLRNAGLIVMRKEGVSSFYRIDDPLVHELCELMCSRLRREMENQNKVLAGI
jgi:ArsR family transcriptional regulator